MSNAPLLALDAITFRYAGAAKPVLRSVDFCLDLGQRVGIVGANGSGKTTLFHLIMGLLRPEAGRVCHRGQVLVTEKDFGPLRREVGLVFQHPDDQLFSPTVLEDVAFGPLNLGLSPAQAKAVAEETLAGLGLAGFEHRLTHRLSGGEKRLVSLATVLAMRPKAVLLDEPTNDLDPDTRLTLIDLLNGLDVALAIISHDWDFLSRVAREFVVVRDGVITPLAEGQPHIHPHVHPGGDLLHLHLNKTADPGHGGVCCPEEPRVQETTPVK